jgi:hypothetical protein
MLISYGAVLGGQQAGLPFEAFSSCPLHAASGSTATAPMTVANLSCLLTDTWVSSFAVNCL